MSGMLFFSICSYWWAVLEYVCAYMSLWVCMYFFHGCVCPEILRMLIFQQDENIQLEPARLSQPGVRGLAGVDKDVLYPPGMQWPHYGFPLLAWVCVKQKGERFYLGLSAACSRTLGAPFFPSWINVDRSQELWFHCNEAKMETGLELRFRQTVEQGPWSRKTTGSGMRWPGFQLAFSSWLWDSIQIMSPLEISGSLLSDVQGQMIFSKAPGEVNPLIYDYSCPFSLFFKEKHGLAWKEWSRWAQLSSSGMCRAQVWRLTSWVWLEAGDGGV